MKNIIKFITIIMFTVITFSNVSADKTQNKIFKELAITTTQVEKDYSKSLNKKLDLYFNKARYFNSTDELKELESKLEPILKEYKNKNYLSIKQKKEFNLIKNIYYRSKYLTLYYVK